MSASELAKVLAVSNALVQKLTTEGMPHDQEGNKKRFDTRKVIDWVVKRGGLDNRGKKTSKDQKNPNTALPLDEDAEDPNEPFSDNLDRQRKLQGDKIELEIQRRKGELIELRAHDEFVNKAGSFCRSAFQAMPKKLAVKLAKEHDVNAIEKILQNEVVSILKELSQMKVEE
jgi:phage terminase Nu1 subunit (DNA packaging protein)